MNENGYTATYSPEDNKLRLYASSRLPKELFERVRAAGFIWAPKQELFVAPMWTPEREDLLIELAGEIGDEDTSLVDRAEQRAERFEDYSDSRAQDAEHARKAVSAIADNIPLGQPILVGHHSEKRARKDAERIENGMRKAVKMWETSQYWVARAKGALRAAKYKELPAVRARRIKGLQADKRKQERSKAAHEKFIKLWTRVENLNQGLAVANYDHHANFISPSERTDGKTWGVSSWDALKGEYLPNGVPRPTLDEVKAVAIKKHTASIPRLERWIAHYENRLAYELAMLDEQGATDLLKPAPKKVQLPICNYRQAVIYVENIYNRGELMSLPQIEMTAAEYAKLHADYKCCRVAEHSHRVRMVMRQSTLYSVFLTDSKIHDKPPAGSPPEPKLPSFASEPRHYQKPEPTPYDAMRETLKAGVRVVSAPQLFPTPPELAKRMVELAEIQSGDCVLEPSAGTGNLIQAVIDTVDTEILAYEINSGLCSALQRKFPSHKAQVRCKDFLTVTDFQGCYPRILMNPPFERGADIQHIKHALTFLKPGGRLVAICANGPRQQEQLQPLASTWIDLEPGTFKESGTQVNTAMIVIDR